MRRGLLATLVAGVVLAGCSETASEPETDPAVEFAVAACSLEISDETDTENGTFEPYKVGEGTWDLQDPLDEHEDRAAEWKARAVAAQSAAQLDSTWEELADAMQFNSYLVDRVVRIRASGQVFDPNYFREFWPEINDDLEQFRENNALIETTCAALAQTLEVTG